MFLGNFSFLALVVGQLAVLLLYIYFARKFQIVDTPNHRSSHSRPTVRGGGILFPVVMTFAIAWNDLEFPWFLTGLLAIATISFWDDVSPLPYVSRLIVQMVSVLLIVFDLNLAWYWYFVLPIPMVAFVNGCNFMDGINGITVTFGLSVLGTMLFVNLYLELFILSSYLVLLIAAIVVFSLFNFRRRALCFAGDVGSVSLAYIIGFLIILMVIHFQNVLFLGLIMVYAVDSSMTILFRIRNHENLTQPHRSHLYQMLANEQKISHLVVASIYGFLQLLVNILVVMLVPLSLGLAGQLLVLLSVYLLSAGCYIWVRFSVRSALDLAF